MATRKKPMSTRRLAERRAIRKQLRVDGILPPKKAPLNRRKFAREAWAEYEGMSDSLAQAIYLDRAIRMTTTRGDSRMRVDDQELGRLKAIKMAVELHRFEAAKNAAGEHSYTIGELADAVIVPVLKL